MYWIPKMHKNQISFRFVLASPVCSIKPLSKDITLIFKLFYEKVERCHTKGKVWSGVKTFWTIQNNFPVISSIKACQAANKRNAAKSMPTFDFLTLYTKIPHDRLLHILNEITDFAFKKVGQDIMLLSTTQEHFGHSPKVKLEFSDVRSCAILC